MNTKFRKLLSVMLSMFVFVGVITTPVLATEAEPVDDTIVEEPEVVAEEEVQEEVAEPTEETAVTEEEVYEDVPVEEAAVTVEEEAAITKASKEDFEVFDEEASEIDLVDLPGYDEEIYHINAEGDPTINAGKTVTDSDGDGIYELALSINATSKQSTETKATRQNIVMVIDVSGSMHEGVNYIKTYTYSESTYNDYVYYNSSTNTNTELHYGTYYRWQQYIIGGRWVVAGTGWYSGAQYGGTAYTGTVYAYDTRLQNTQKAACDVVDALLAKNQNDDGITDMFEITVIKFANLVKDEANGYNGTETLIQDSTNGTAIKNVINGLTPGGGTNWEAALNLALSEANYFKNEDPDRTLDPEEKTSVIFLTDGYPTLYVNNNGNQDGDGQETDDNIATSYSQSRPSARTIVSSGYDLYSIFAFGNDTVTHNGHSGFAYLCGLTNYAHGSGTGDNFDETPQTDKYAFNAKSPQSLIDAFKSIINHITDSAGYAGVNLTDGVSLGATSTSVAVNGTAKADRMRYTVADDTGRIAYTVKINADGSADFEIYNADGTKTQATASTYTEKQTDINGTVITSKVYSVNVEGYDEPFMMSPATINADTGMVTWDLAGLGILKNGYTYTVAFDVWPNQVAYDICADLNNGLYASVEAALDAYGITDETERKHIKDAIVKNADGSYSLYTNYEQSIEFYPAESQTDDEGNVTWTYGDKATQPIEQPDPIPLKGSSLPLRKAWESGLSPNELNEVLWEDGVVDGTSKEYQITLKVWKAESREKLEADINDPDADPYIVKVLGWDDEESKYIFEKSAAVAPGMMLNVTEAARLGYDVTDETHLKEFTNEQGTTLTYYVIEPGHYYYVTEEGSDLHFELETDIYHPMIVDGTLYNVFFGEGKTVTQMDQMSAVVATNKLKGGLNIHKIVSTTPVSVEDGELVGVTEPVDEDGIETVTDEFTFEIKIWKEDEEGNKSAVWTYDDQIDTTGEKPKTKSGSIGYRVFVEPSLNSKGEIEYNTESENYLRGAILPEDSPYADLANGIYATVTETETTITLTMPANGEIRLVNLPSGTQYTVKEIEDETGTYTYAATLSSIKTSNKTEEADGEISTENEVSGKITGNTASVETYYNWAANFYVYHSSDNTIEKISFADTRVKGEYDEEKKEYTYTFNIVDEVKDVEETEGASISDFLYGGYYKVYAGAVATDEEINGTTDEGVIEYDEDNWGTDKEGAKPYDYQYILDSGMKAWTYADAYTEVNGLEMNPEVNGVYYLKEVPNGYIRPYLHYTYNKTSKVAQAMWLVSDIDDANYQETGFLVDDGKQVAKVVASLTVKTGTGSSTVKLSPESAFRTKGVKKGYLTYITATKYLVANASYTTKEYWVTPDGLIVEGVTTRTINIGTKKISGTNKLAATDEDGLSVVTKKE